MIAAHGVLGKSCAILGNPKQMVPSLMEKGARLFVARFLRQFISTGCFMWVHSYFHIIRPFFFLLHIYLLLILFFQYQTIPYLCSLGRTLSWNLVICLNGINTERAFQAWEFGMLVLNWKLLEKCSERFCGTLNMQTYALRTKINLLFLLPYIYIYYQI